MGRPKGSTRSSDVDANITEFKRKMQDYIQALCGQDYRDEEGVARQPVARVALESRGQGKFERGQFATHGSSALDDRKD